MDDNIQHVALHADEPTGRWQMTVLFAETSPEVDAILARRQQLGVDGKDEVWEGVYHVAPIEHRRNVRTAARLGDLLRPYAGALGLECLGPFNLGRHDDYRVPDLSLVPRGEGDALYNATAAAVIEVLSPRDQTFAKFGFYAAHGVEELWVVDPLERSVRIWQLDAVADAPEGSPREYTETGRSDLLDLTASTVEEQLDWPQG